MAKFTIALVLGTLLAAVLLDVTDAACDISTTKCTAVPTTSPTCCDYATTINCLSVQTPTTGCIAADLAAQIATYKTDRTKYGCSGAGSLVMSLFLVTILSAVAYKWK